ncbi:hypothetical protein DH2020_000357 [Rehmannia glutinosa]|uniref:Uncharacterized protein n=1 Tax=Rehmannia glutinosa TaxID=99300 RepID=A0ABR0XWN3_REHGL
MVLVLALGDLHIPHRAPDLPAKFKSMLFHGRPRIFGHAPQALGVVILVTAIHTDSQTYKHEVRGCNKSRISKSVPSKITYDVNPSFVLMDIDGLRVVVYVYELIDGEVKVDKINFKKATTSTNLTH